jgi:histidine triad (HIT) family protein
MINKEENCIFCKIVAGELPANKIYEDDYTLAFLSIGPKEPGHTLVIPKDHFENILGTPDETLCRTILTAKKIALAVKNGLEPDGVNVAMVGKDISHFHIHVIPRDDSAEDQLDWPIKAYLPGEAEEVVMKIKFALD